MGTTVTKLAHPPRIILSENDPKYLLPLCPPVPDLPGLPGKLLLGFFLPGERHPFAFGLGVLSVPSGKLSFLARSVACPQLRFIQGLTALALLAFGAG